MRRASSPLSLATASVVIGLLIACLAWFVPYLTRDRETTSSVPVPPPYFAASGIGLARGDQACLADVAFDTDSQIVELTALAGKGPGPELAVTASAPGYSAQATIEGGYGRPLVLRAPLDPPERSAIGTLCVENRGPRAVGLLGTADPRTVVARPTTQVNGVATVPDISVRLLAADSGSVLQRASELVGRAAAFKPGALGEPTIWIVLLLVVCGLAGGALYSVISSFRASER
jgi:hypothetical protein